jgi:hypothetical protein
MSYRIPPDMDERPVVIVGAGTLGRQGETAEAIIDLLMRKLPQYGFVPFHVRRESDGSSSIGSGRRSSANA